MDPSLSDAFGNLENIHIANHDKAVQVAEDEHVRANIFQAVNVPSMVLMAPIASKTVPDGTVVSL